MLVYTTEYYIEDMIYGKPLNIRPGYGIVMLMVNEKRNRMS